MSQGVVVPPGYERFVADLKDRIRAAQVGAALSVSRELIQLYWGIGRDICLQQDLHGWGDAVLDRVSSDLADAMPGIEGFSRRNLYRMRALYLAYRHLSESVPQAVAQIPWGHNAILLTKCKDTTERLWYAQAAFTHGWSRAVLEHQIESRLRLRQGAAVTNFSSTITPPRSDLAQQALKDPYNFDFLTLRDDAQERDIELALVEHIRAFLLELGVGFAFVGDQYHLDVGGRDYYVDLLFYHLHLRCFVVVELKAVAFEPEFAGKLNFYLSAVDDLLRHRDDVPSVGILLCKSRDQTVVEYALRDMSKPIGVAAYELTNALPPGLHASLPTVEQLEQELQGSAERRPDSHPSLALEPPGDSMPGPKDPSAGQDPAPRP